jgi:hypothetical protein
LITVITLLYRRFADLLKRVAARSFELLIVGDVNIHFDDVNDPFNAKFLSLLFAHSLVQRVQTATHNSGHQIDVIVIHVGLPFS